MKKLVFGICCLALLVACNQAETEVVQEVKNIEIKEIEDIEIFQLPDQTNALILEEEIKESLKTYLDSSGDLNRAIFQLEQVQYVDETEVETFQQLKILSKENDENFSTYVSSNTLPETYRADSEHISLYITASNQYMDELEESIDSLIDEVIEGKISLDSLTSMSDSSDIVNGREQAKIEKFLEEKGIETNAFIIE